MYNWFDRSPQIKNLIKRLSSTLASQRGIPMIVAIAMTVVSLIVHLIAVMTNSQIVSLCGFTILHIGIITGFVGILLAEPLGRG